MRKNFVITVFLTILIILSAIVAPAFSAERERVDVLLYMIDQNINGQITGEKLEARLKTWEYNVHNTIDNLNELLKEVSGLKAQGDETNLPGNSGILAALKERKKNFTVILEYRRALETFMKGLKAKSYSSRQAFLDEFNDKMDKLSSLIDENEPLIVLERFDIPSRILTLRDELNQAGSEQVLELVNKEWLASRDVFLEYKREVSDLEKLRLHYIKIYKYSIGEGGNPGNLTEEGSGVTPSKPGSRSLSFTPYWGDSLSWRQLNVGDSINPRIENVTGGSGLLSYLWTMDGNVIGRQQYANYRFNKPGMHYLVARVQDSTGRSQWKSYVYNVRGGDNLHFNLDISDTSPDPGETVFFKITNVYGGSPPYQIRWEMNNSYLGSGYYANYQFPRSGSFTLRVRVRDQNGEEREDTRSFNLGSAGQLTFDLWTSNNNPRTGETVQFEFRDVRGGSSPYHYTWSSNTGASGTGERFSYTFRNSGLHRLKVTAFDQYKRKTVKYYTYRTSGGGSSGAIKARINYSTDRPSLGQLVTLNAANISGGSPPYRYEWLVDGSKISEDASVRNTWYRNGNSKVTLKVYDSQGSSSSVHQTFKVGAGGEGNLTFNDSISNSNPKQHDSVTFKAENVRGGTPPYSYRWEVNGFTVSIFDTTTYRFNQPGTFTVKITVKDNAGRVAERSRTVRVSGSSSPLNANFNWNNKNPRLGDTVTFQISNVNGGNPPYTYTHKIDNNVISNSSSADYRFDRNRAYRYQAEVRDSSGAVRNVTKDFTIQGSSEPLSFDINVSNSSPRQGETVNFYARNIKGGTPPYEVNWTMNGQRIGGGQNASYRFGTGSFTLNATVRDRAGAQVSRSYNFNVQASSNPFNVNFSWSENAPPVGKPINLKAYNFNGGQAPYNVKWFVDGQQIGTGDNLNYTFNKPGNYNLRAEAIDALGQRKTTSHTFKVSGSGSPGPGQADDIFFSITISNSNPRVGETVHFDVSNLRGGNPPYNIAWSLSQTGNIGNSRRVIWKFRKPGIHAVSCTVSDSSGRSRVIRRNLRVK